MGRPDAAAEVARPYWNPCAVGVLLGLVLLATYLIAGRGLGATGAFVGDYCPGTAIAAIATGRKDARVFALGMLSCVMACAEVTPGIEAWIAYTAQGEMTLPSITGIGMGCFVLAFLAFLAVAAWGMS